MSLVDALGSFVGGGGLATAFGTVVGAVTKYKERKLETAHELAMTPHKEKQWQFEAAMAKRQADHDKFMAEQDFMIEVERGSLSMQQSVIESDAATAVVALGMKDQKWWVGAIKTLFRPFLTMVLWLFVFALFLKASENSAYQQQIVDTVTNGAGATLGIWFGGRISRYNK